MPLTLVSCAISDASMSWGSPVSVLKLEQSVFTWKLWAKRCGAVMGRGSLPWRRGWPVCTQRCPV